MQLELDSQKIPRCISRLEIKDMRTKVAQVCYILERKRIGNLKSTHKDINSNLYHKI